MYSEMCVSLFFLIAETEFTRISMFLGGVDHMTELQI
jgi:hypothetical protein